MKRLRKKALAVLLTAAMIVGLAPAAFAGTFSDVPGDASYAGAVERLAGLGVVQGMGGGKYEPNGTFTRAQAAAIAVRLRGIKTAGSGTTDFKDVPADHWASGWINLAVGLGIIKGMGDGTFHPEDPVTHAQWLTMVLRVLGYGPQVDKMSWPAGVLAKAALLGLDNGVNVTANLPANRAEVATIADNSLTKEIVDCGFDANGNVTNCAPKANTSIAATYLKSTKEPPADTAMLKASPEVFGNASDMVTIGANAKTLAGASYKGLLGHQVVGWLNSDGKVFFLEDKTAAGDIKTAKVDAANAKLTIDGSDVKDDSLAAGGAQVFKNAQSGGVQATAANLYTAVNVTGGAADNAEAVAIMKDGKVAAVIVTSSTVRIVDSVSTAFESMGTKTIAGGNDSLSLKDKTVTWSGAASKLADVQKGDVIEYYAANVGGKDYVNIVVTRNTKSGDFTRVDAAGDKVTVGGTQYDEAATFNADANLLGKAVKITLNKHGKVVAMESAAAEAAKIIGAVWTDPWDTNVVAIDNQSKVRVVKSDGTNAIYVVAKDATVDKDNDGVNDIAAFDPAPGGNQAAGLIANNVQGTNVIEFTVNSNGEINSITVLHDTANVAEDANLNVDKDNNTIEETDGGAKIAVTTATVIFDVTAAEPKIVTRSALMNDNNGTVTAKVVRTKAGEALAKAIAVTADLNAPTSDTYGLHTGEYQTSGPKYYFSINSKGTTTDYEVTNASYAAYAPDNVLKYNPGDVKGSVVGVTEKAVSDAAYVWKVQEIDATNKIVYVDEYDTATGAENPVDKRAGYMFGDKSQVFNLNGDNAATSAAFGDLAVGQRVHIYDDNADSVLEVITIH